MSCGKKPATSLKVAATAHSATLGWTQPCSTCTVNIYRDGAKVTSGIPATVLQYIDTAVAAGETHSYQVSNVLAGAESSLSAAVSATIPGGITPPPPPPPICIALAAGCRVSVVSTANIRQAPTSNTVVPALYGIEPAGALGTVLAISPFGYTAFGVQNWVQVKFDTCVAAIPGCTGYMGNNNMTIVSAPPPPPPPPPTPLTLTCVKNVCTIGGGTSPQSGQIQITPGGPTATWSK